MAKKKVINVGRPESEAERILNEIAHMGVGLKPEIIDWQNIGKNAVHVARNYLAGKCSECGHQKPWVRTEL